MRIDHINIRAPAELIEKVKAFYCDLFDMVAGPRPTFRQGGYWLYAGDRALLHLSIDPDAVCDGQAGFLDHIAFQGSDVETLTGRLETIGLRFRTNHIPELNMTQVFFTDPAGNGIEVNFPGERPR